MKYINEFLDTVLGFKEADKLLTAIGAALYNDQSVKNKVFVLYGGSATGKTSILQPLSQFTYEHYDPIIIVHDNADLSKWEVRDDNKVRFCSTNKNPEELNLSERYVIIKMSGERMPFENYKKFYQEMLYFPEEFFKKCMNRFIFNTTGELPGGGLL